MNHASHSARTDSYHVQSSVSKTRFNDPRVMDYDADFVVKRFSDLLTLAGLWVALLACVQVMAVFYLSAIIEHEMAMPLPYVAAGLLAVYLALDVMAYLLLRGRMIFHWMVPAIWLAGAALVPCAVVYVFQSNQPKVITKVITQVRLNH